MPIYKKVNKQFFKIWSDDMVYVLGFFSADGYITHNKRGASFWSIQITDEGLIESIKKVIGSDHKINVRKRSGNESNLYRLQIGSKEMCEDLYHLGFTQNKTKNLKIPNIPKKYFPSFLRGYFDGDGNVWIGEIHKDRVVSTTTLQVSFTSTSKEFLESLNSLLKKFGTLGGSLFELKSKEAYRLTYSVKDSLKIYKMMYNDKTSLFLERKREVFKKFMRP